MSASPTASGLADAARAAGELAASTSLPTIHHLACDPAPFADLWARKKRHEVRRLDGRTYREGDRLILSEREPATQILTGRVLWLRVTSLTPPGAYGLPDDVAVMSVEETDRASLFRVPSGRRPR